MHRVAGVRVDVLKGARLHDVVQTNPDGRAAALNVDTMQSCVQTGRVHAVN